MDRYNENESDIFKIEIDEVAKANFLEMARWTKFLAILGFIVMALAVVITIGVSTLFANNANFPLGAFGGVGIAIFYIVILGFYIYPIYALYQYSVNIKKAILTSNQAQFNKAIVHLKNMFRYMGILAVIGIVLYGIILIIIGFAAAFRR